MLYATILKCPMYTHTQNNNNYYYNNNYNYSTLSEGGIPHISLYFFHYFWYINVLHIYISQFHTEERGGELHLTVSYRGEGWGATSHSFIQRRGVGSYISQFHIEERGGELHLTVSYRGEGWGATSHSFI